MKRSSLPLIFCFILFISVIRPVYAAESIELSYTILHESINKSERDDRLYQVIKLKNNMKVLLISDTKAVKSLGSLALPIGSLYDPKSQQGLAHFTEHMVLMGSKKYPEPSSFSEYLSSHAGSYNASTALDRTSFYFEVDNNAFAGALDRLADAIAEPLLDAKYTDKERNAVNSELTLARSSDGHRLGQVDSETINQDHPASMFSGGNLQTLSDKPESNLHQELIKFHQHYYSADKMVGVIYSNLTLNELANLAVNTYGRISHHGNEIEPITQRAITTANLGKMIYMEPAQPKKVLFIQFPIENNLPQFADKSDEYIAYMINHHDKNTLFWQLQKQGLIESISAFNDPLRYGTEGMYGIFINLTDQGLAEKDKVIASLFSYLQLLREKGIKPEYYNELQKILALDFKYPDITRDMSYVNWLSGQLLNYPIEHILDADYVATHFNPEKIAKRIESFTPSNARIWLIAPNQNTDKRAYFVDAPYRINAISQQQIDEIMQQAKQLSFDLPKLNPYISDRFEVFPNSALENHKDQHFNVHGNYFHFASKYFKDEPKAIMTLSLRNNFSLNSAKNQVMFFLLDYLVNRELATLNYQAEVAGISISTQVDSGVMIKISGFNQHLQDMMKEVLSVYQSFAITDENLLLAKSWYQETLDRADDDNSYSLAMQPVNALGRVPYFDRQVKRENITSITVADLMQFRDSLFIKSVPYMLVLGNIADEQSHEFYNTVKKQLDAKSSYQPEQVIKVNKTMTALIDQHGKSTDHALFVGFIPKSYDKVTGTMTSYLLSQIISPWTFNQLRSNEQLGYVVFTLPVHIGDSSGIGFLIQSNQYDPTYINTRYQALYPILLEKLTALSDEDFNKYKQSILNEMSMPSQTLDEEFSDYISDYALSLFDFNSKEKNMAKLKQLTKQDVITFFQQSIIEHNGLILASEVIGQQPDKVFQQISGLTQYKTASQLQEELLKE